MEPIIAPVDKELIKAELTPDRFMRDTRKGGNKIYIIDCNNAPNVMREIGRWRKLGNSTNSILWTRLANNSSYGIPMPKKS